jgi:hypothetical protein
LQRGHTSLTVGWDSGQLMELRLSYARVTLLMQQRRGPSGLLKGGCAYSTNSCGHTSGETRSSVASSAATAPSVPWAVSDRPGVVLLAVPRRVLPTERQSVTVACVARVSAMLHSYKVMVQSDLLSHAGSSALLAEPAWSAVQVTDQILDSLL